MKDFGKSMMIVSAIISGILVVGGILAFFVSKVGPVGALLTLPILFVLGAVLYIIGKHAEE